ncbi:nitroreductase family protein, partial [Myxococcota bacterium]
LLRKRRTQRGYTGEKISEEHLQLLQEAVLRSPSSRSIKPWEFVFVDDPDLIEKLSRSKPHGASFLKNAALAIVVCGDQTKSDAWVEDCSIASIFAQLTAESLGLGNCWIQIRMRQHESGDSAESYIQKLLGIPEQVKVESIIAVGHPADQLEGHPRDSLDFSKIRRNRYQ